MSLAMYYRLRSVIDSWDEEERGKAKVIAGAIGGLLAWGVLLVVGVLLAPRYAGLLLPIGFLAWVVLVVVLIRRHLGARPRKPES